LWVIRNSVFIQYWNHCAVLESYFVTWVHLLCPPHPPCLHHLYGFRSPSGSAHLCSKRWRGLMCIINLRNEPNRAARFLGSGEYEHCNPTHVSWVSMESNYSRAGTVFLFLGISSHSGQPFISFSCLGLLFLWTCISSVVDHSSLTLQLKWCASIWSQYENGGCRLQEVYGQTALGESKCLGLESYGGLLPL
jgi:hypothetical protein